MDSYQLHVIQESDNSEQLEPPNPKCNQIFLEAVEAIPQCVIVIFVLYIYYLLYIHLIRSIVDKTESYQCVIIILHK